MACPNTEDGFVMISLELGAALAMARLTTAEQVIVWEVVSRTYGPAKAPLAAISATDLARRTGLDRTFLAKGLRSLLDSGILAEGKERGEYKLQKNYDRWDRSAHKESDESARARREYARAAVRAARSYPKQAPPDCGNTATVADSGCGNTATVGVAILPQSCGNTATPILLEDSLDLREKTPQPPEGESVVESDEKPATIPIQPAPISSVPTTYDELYRWVEAITKTQYVTEKLYVIAAGYPVEWVFHALRCCSGQNKPEQRWESYANGCLIRWHQNKGINWDEVKRDTSSKTRDVGKPIAVTDEDREFLERRKAALARNKGA